ncbi:MAG: hypothetical protein ACFB00_13060 [Parvularculaceae bacterium]
MGAPDAIDRPDAARGGPRRPSADRDRLRALRGGGEDAGEARREVARAMAIFAKKGEALPLVDKKGGAEAPEEVVAENRSRLSGLGVINERSDEAGYPANPTPEEVAAFEAELAALFGDPQTEDDAPAAVNAKADVAAAAEPETSGGAVPSFRAAPVAAAPNAAAPKAASNAAENPVAPPAAAPAVDLSGGLDLPVTLRLPAADVLRLKLAAAVLREGEAGLVAKALTAYFDALGVDRFDDAFGGR